MSQPWLDQPVMLHSSREAGMCSMTPEQCAFKTSYWLFWYEADRRYALPTTAFFLTAIALASIGHFASVYAPSRVRHTSLWRRITSLARYLSYKSWRFASWNTPSLATYLLAAVGAVFFLAMTLGPRPYYWPNTRDISFGNSPPIATRAGYMALACLPFLFVLGAKANPISTLTGISHEKLNIWHNWVAWAMFVLALIHTFPFIVFHHWKGDLVESFNDGGVWLTGVIALLAQAWLTLMSIRWIRDRYYEFFKATHFFAAAVFFVFFFLHCDFRLSSWDYFIATAVLYALSWFYSQFKTFKEHGVSHARLSLVTPNSLMVVIETNTRWTPGQHVYLRFLTCGLHALTSHPFTISSVPQHRKRSCMVFYMQPRGGITGRLATLAQKSPGTSVPVLLDGPYGGVTGRWFRGFDRTLVVTGGAGAGFSLAMVEHFIDTRSAGSQLDVVVASHDAGFREWYCQVLNNMIERKGAVVEDVKGTTQITVRLHETQSQTRGLTTGSEPRTLNDKDTSTTASTEAHVSAAPVSTQVLAGRPNLPSIAQATIQRPGSVGIVVCGPSSMVFDLRQSAASAQKSIMQGKTKADEVWFYDESFSF